MTTQAKICGIKTVSALDAALDDGADYVGFVFFERSPRNIDVSSAAKLADRARGKAKIVGLVVDADEVLLAEIADAVRPDFLQLHGKEPPERVAAIKKKFGIPIIKAVAVETPGDAADASIYDPVADMILFDAKPPKAAILPGGNGMAFDWHALDGIRKGKPFMLSGGLNANNVADAIRVTGASAVDVSSGVESAPGVKDAQLIRRFLHAAKTAKQP